MRITETHLYFWGGYLSQWHLCNFSVDGVSFTSAEQYMMYYKAKIFNDVETMNMVLNTNNPKVAKALGRQVKNFNNDIWNDVKYEIVLAGNLLKFSQNEELRKALSDTNGLVLVEASPTDNIWGVGLSENDDLILDEKNWRGQNLLGQALMETRWLLGD